MSEIEKKLTKEEAKEKAKRKLALQAKYTQRITIAKNGREMFLGKEYVGAARKYAEYLGILAETNELDDIYQLAPSMFDDKRDLTEMLLISHVYWELSRIYEMTPKLQKSYEKSLKQFIRFTINQPYQVLNSEMLRKYIKQNKKVSPQIGALEKAFSQIQVQSKKCYIATHAFGQEHWVTQELRQFKQVLLSTALGLNFVSTYYSLSSRLVKIADKEQKLAFTLRHLSRTPLLLCALALKSIRKR
ncbi:MAG: hypothetical protein KC478_11495 [Bacteriovoracaceae bacterium]|nr:hypothetical protein [Bacteriovoracaceae bacterium]